MARWAEVNVVQSVLRHHHVVAVDEFGRFDIPENGFNLTGRTTGNPTGIGCAVVDQTARDLAALRIDTGDYVATNELSHHVCDANG